jgi:transposase
MARHYPGELSDKEWALIEPIFQRPHIKNGGRKNAGRKPKYDARVMLNAIFYVLRAGCAWHLLPHDFPPWQTVYSQFQRWQRNGVFTRLHDHVRGRLRSVLGRAVDPSAGILDSQSVKTTEKGGSVDTMRGKKSKAGKGILPLTRKGFCYRRMLRVAM